MRRLEFHYVSFVQSFLFRLLSENHNEMTRFWEVERNRPAFTPLMVLISLRSERKLKRWRAFSIKEKHLMESWNGKWPI